jgi:hypothetical protein
MTCRISKYLDRKLSDSDLLQKHTIIQDIHHSRLERYMSYTGLNIQQATFKLIDMHRKGMNIASHISEVINDSHRDYCECLFQLGEYKDFIR